MKELIISLIFTLNCQSYLDYETVIALSIKESGVNPAMIRDGDYGLFQIRESVLKDYNRFAGSSYKIRDLMKAENNTRIAVWNLCRRKQVKSTRTALGMYHLGGYGYWEAKKENGIMWDKVEKYIDDIIFIREVLKQKNNWLELVKE